MPERWVGWMSLFLETLALVRPQELRADLVDLFDQVRWKFQDEQLIEKS
jgi:hypothetical protein